MRSGGPRNTSLSREVFDRKICARQISPTRGHRSGRSSGHGKLHRWVVGTNGTASPQSIHSVPESTCSCPRTHLSLPAAPESTSPVPESTLVIPRNHLYRFPESSLLSCPRIISSLSRNYLYCVPESTCLSQNPPLTMSIRAPNPHLLWPRIYLCIS